MRYDEPLLSPSELAMKLGRSVDYVHAMSRSGFRMSGYRATLSEAREWLYRNGGPDWEWKKKKQKD